MLNVSDFTYILYLIWTPNFVLEAKKLQNIAILLFVLVLC